MVEKLREAKVGVRCGEEQVPALLFEDDMVILAEGEEELRRGLGVLEEWCSEWAMKVNADKCGVMHLRRNGVKRTTSLFSVGGERVKVVKSYKYLGCIVNEHMDCREIVRERATAGRGALSAWLWRCRMSVGEVRGKTFVKLMEALVESASMYGAEVWGSCKWLDCIDQVQLRAYRIFLGVGRLHPKTSLQIEMGLLPWKWEAKMRCIQFWHKVMKRRKAGEKGSNGSTVTERKSEVAGELGAMPC